MKFFYSLLYWCEIREIQIAAAELSPQERKEIQNILNIVNRNRYRNGLFGNDLMTKNEFEKIIQVLKNE